MIWPVWQNGTPQSMQRAPCSRKHASGMCSWNSCQSNTRSAAGRVTGTVRVYSMKPVVLTHFRFVQQAPSLLPRRWEEGWGEGFNAASTLNDICL